MGKQSTPPPLPDALPPPSVQVCPVHPGTTLDGGPCEVCLVTRWRASYGFPVGDPTQPLKPKENRSVRRKVFPIVAATLMVASLASPALAATTGQVTESLTVNQLLSLTLDKSAITYGSQDPGSSTPSSTVAERTVGATVTANAGWTLTISGSALTSGANSIPASARNVKEGAGGTWTALGSPATFTGGAGTVVRQYEFYVAVPANTPAGAYTGTVTFSVTAP